MKRRLWLSAAAATALGASGCAGPSINDYAQEKPILDLKTYFNGVIDAWGVFTDRSGRVVKRFTVVMNCSWNGEQGVLMKTLSTQTAAPKNAFGNCNTLVTATTAVPPMMWWGLPMALPEATPFAGATPWLCR